MALQPLKLWDHPHTIYDRLIHVRITNRRNVNVLAVRHLPAGDAVGTANQEERVDYGNQYIEHKTGKKWVFMGEVFVGKYL
jgi:hypothetical protein